MVKNVEFKLEPHFHHRMRSKLSLGEIIITLNNPQIAAQGAGGVLFKCTGAFVLGVGLAVLNISDWSSTCSM